MERRWLMFKDKCEQSIFLNYCFNSGFEKSCEVPYQIYFNADLIKVAGDKIFYRSVYDKNYTKEEDVLIIPFREEGGERIMEVIYKHLQNTNKITSEVNKMEQNDNVSAGMQLINRARDRKNKYWVEHYDTLYKKLIENSKSYEILSKAFIEIKAETKADFDIFEVIENIRRFVYGKELEDAISKLWEEKRDALKKLDEMYDEIELMYKMCETYEQRKELLISTGVMRDVSL